MNRAGSWGTGSWTSHLACFSATLPSLDLFPWCFNLTAVLTWLACGSCAAVDYIQSENNKRTYCNAIKACIAYDEFQARVTWTNVCLYDTDVVYILPAT